MLRGLMSPETSGSAKVAAKTIVAKLGTSFDTMPTLLFGTTSNPLMDVLY